ncbi:MAG: TIGR02391 family protein [Pyrinomonadaceae bacterium]
MAKREFSLFERLTRRAHLFSDEAVTLGPAEHPFEARNVHPMLPPIVKQMFDDGYYSQATFEACKYVDKEVARISLATDSGFKLMMKVFSETSPLVALTPVSTESERDEQKGYQFLFAGAVMAIRNPRGHEYTVRDSIDECLDHLGIISSLLRRIEKAGFSLNSA